MIRIIVSTYTTLDGVIESPEKWSSTIAHPGDLKTARHARCATLKPRGGARCGY